MQHTTTMHIHKLEYGTEFALYGCDMTAYGSIYVAPLEVTFEVPDDWGPRPAQIAAIKASQLKAAAEFEKLTTDNMRRISELQAIEYVAAV